MCAYCGTETELLMEHAIPINKEKLGEHRLGNLVPSCTRCNSDKGGRDFRAFLGENTAAIRRIETYMDSRNYVPLEDNEQIKSQDIKRRERFSDRKQKPSRSSGREGVN